MYCGRQEHAASSSGQKTGMEISTKMFIPTYQIMWCHIVNYDGTHIQRLTTAKSKSSSWHTASNTSPPSPQKKERKQRSPNFVQKEAGIIYSAWNKMFNPFYFVFPCVTPRESFQFKFKFLYFFHKSIMFNKALRCRTCQV